MNELSGGHLVTNTDAEIVDVNSGAAENSPLGGRTDRRVNRVGRGGSAALAGLYSIGAEGDVSRWCEIGRYVRRTGAGGASSQSRTGADTWLADWKASKRPGDLQILGIAIGDIEGHLRPSAWPDYDRSANARKRQMGGLAHVGGLIDRVRTQVDHSFLFSAGDNFGSKGDADCLVLDNRPIIDGLGWMGLGHSGVGNHDAYKLAELAERNAANDLGGIKYLDCTLVDDQGNLLFAPYRILAVDGKPVLGLVGATHPKLGSMIHPSNMNGVRLLAAVPSINAAVAELNANGVPSCMLLYHDGSESGSDRAEPVRRELDEPLATLDRELDSNVLVVHTGHTHRAFLYIGNRLFGASGAHGSHVTLYGITIDASTRRLRKVDAFNHEIYPDSEAPDPEQVRIVDEARERARPILEQRIRTGGPILKRATNSEGQSPIGTVIADAMLQEATLHAKATQSAAPVVAFISQGGLRADLTPDRHGAISFGALRTVFASPNALVSMTLTGAQLLRALEQQWRQDSYSARDEWRRLAYVLQPSFGLTYEWDGQRPAGQRVVPGSLKFKGRQILPHHAIRLVVSDYVADGKEYSVFNEGQDRVVFSSDMEATRKYLSEAAAIKVDDARIRRRN